MVIVSFYLIRCVKILYNLFLSMLQQRDSYHLGTSPFMVTGTTEASS